MDTLLPGTPESYTQLLKRSIKLYRRSFSSIILLLSLLLSITVFIPRLLTYFCNKDFFAGLTLLSPHVLWIALINLASFMFFIALIWHVHCVIRKVHEPLKQDMTIGLKKMIYAFIAILLQTMIMLAVIYTLFLLDYYLYIWQILNINYWFSALLFGVFFLAQVLLIIYIATLFIFYLPLIAIENKGILSSLKYSILLVWNHCFRTFSLQMTPWIFYFILLFFMKYTLGINIHIYFIAGEYQPIWVTVLHIIIFTLFAPWVASTLLIQLRDLEIRNHIVPKKT